jgi:hypothetical protein
VVAQVPQIAQPTRIPAPSASANRSQPATSSAAGGILRRRPAHVETRGSRNGTYVGTDVVVPERARLAQCELERLLPARRERDLAGRRRALAAPDDLDHLLAGGVERHAEAGERRKGEPLLLAKQAEQEVLTADVAVSERPGLVLCEDDDLSGTFGEALEHAGSA